MSNAVAAPTSASIRQSRMIKCLDMYFFRFIDFFFSRQIYLFFFDSGCLKFLLSDRLWILELNDLLCIVNCALIMHQNIATQKTCNSVRGIFPVNVVYMFQVN